MIIDLRGNGGGNMYPMLVLASDSFSAKAVSVYFASVGGTEDDWWFYQQGSADEMNVGRETVNATIRNSPLTLPSPPPVALLVDGGTASSGEATAISFIGLLIHARLAPIPPGLRPRTMVSPFQMARCSFFPLRSKKTAIIAGISTVWSLTWSSPNHPYSVPKAPILLCWQPHSGSYLSIRSKKRRPAPLSPVVWIWMILTMILTSRPVSADLPKHDPGMTPTGLSAN